jgi:hypothetical protein
MIEQALNPDPYLRYMSAHFGWRQQEPHEATGVIQPHLPSLRRRCADSFASELSGTRERRKSLF